MKSIFNEITTIPYQNNIGLLNMTGEFFALYINRLLKEEKKGILIVTPSLYEANKLYEAISNYQEALLFQVDDIFTSKTIASSPELKVERLSTLNKLLIDKNQIVITDIKGYLKYLPKKETYQNLILNLKVGQKIRPNDLCENLFERGYNKDSLVTSTGEYAKRGFVVDVYPLEEEFPYRIEFFGDEIESIRIFDPISQKSSKQVSNMAIYPYKENSYKLTEKISLITYMDNPIVVFKDYHQLELSNIRMIEDFFSYENEEQMFFEFDEINPKEIMHYLDFDNEVSSLNISKLFDCNSKSIEPFEENFEKINKYLKKHLELGYTIILSLPHININKLFDYVDINYVLTEENNIQINKLNVIKNPMNKGFIKDKYIFITQEDLFNRKTEIKRKINHYKYSSRIKDISKIDIGDYVVHNSHGIGVYNGIKTLNKKNIISDYIEVLYAKGDKLYIPASKIEFISKYSGKEGYVPKINALNSQVWAATKAKVREKIKYEAARLIKVQAKRELERGFAFSKDVPMQLLFEEEFIYEETPDQIKVVKEIKEDMENILPMDRILCGDVGYGKTEVAFRAMFKAVLDSKQVLYVCPTTLLSKQQYETAKERFKNFPVTIGLLNRFTSQKETKRILKELEEGKIDIVFGTHRLFSEDVKPKDLGFLVIDEEQRFGVAHKERIKEFKSEIDVLTLTATPIPRTLQLAMLGLKNLSIIETPPKHRKAVQTYVTPYDKKIIRDIIYKEISRKGQVFILYNKVEDIEIMKIELERLAPDARIVYAHGQMPKKELENRVNDFIEGKYDILLCTTIIETGIDIPNANSLIILDANNFGLSQLYQIRGRVGRSDQVAYAYLMYNKNKVLTETAVKRLKVIKDFTQLGSGFTIATRDLSIRGAGDILGAQQAGFIDSVGIDLYMKILNDEVRRLKGLEVEEETEEANPSVEVSDHVSDTYATEDSLKIEIHKLITSIDSKDSLEKIKQEIEDRFGKLDDNLLLYMQRVLFEKLTIQKGIEKVIDNNNYVEIIFSKEKSELIDYQELFIKSLSISKDLKFEYKNKRFNVKIHKKKTEFHPIIYFNKLLQEM